MSRVRGKDTRPEMAVRRTAHSMGLRFRLHRKDLPGAPDLVFPRRHIALFVHGCFWHRHAGCRLAADPKTRPDFWVKKFQANVERDRRAIEKLEQMGWRTVVVWECETRDTETLRNLLVNRLRGPG
ncbi:DNA mismatch endonuclease Vsr [Dyella sp. Sa]|uniref:DNA mismatch endonuclease Vsr n=2 Tax=Dyella lutea TaxID=2950441 RepID=A0ABT1FEP7_9GAMM|nr:DNA mismatch endonuclease Vsr [Dyella lutea]